MCPVFLIGLTAASNSSKKFPLVLFKSSEKLNPNLLVVLLPICLENSSLNFSPSSFALGENSEVVLSILVGLPTVLANKASLAFLALNNNSLPASVLYSSFVNNLFKSSLYKRCLCAKFPNTPPVIVPRAAEPTSSGAE